MSSPPLMWLLLRHCNWYQMWNGFFEEFRLSLEMKTLTFQINCTYVGGNTLSWSFGQYLQNSRAKSLMHVKFHSIWPVALHSERSGDLLLMIPWKFIRFLYSQMLPKQGTVCRESDEWVVRHLALLIYQFTTIEVESLMTTMRRTVFIVDSLLLMSNSWFWHRVLLQWIVIFGSAPCSGSWTEPMLVLVPWILSY